MSRATTTTTTERLYKPFRLRQELFGSTFDKNWIHSDFLQLIETFQNASSSSSTTLSKEEALKLSQHYIKEEIDDVYSFNCWTKPFLSQFNEEIDHFYAIAETKNIPIRRPNSMNNYGVIVNEIGMYSLLSSFQKDYLHPIAKVLFPIHGSKFHDHHSFMVRYQPNEDLGLDMHIDDSDVTFNICLGQQFTGATLTFCGNFGSSNHRKHSYTYSHEIGRAVLHLGTRRHGADDIESGIRTNLIIWNHNLDWRSSVEYARSRRSGVLYERERAPPDLVCLSYTHDRDYLFYHKDGYPKAAEKANLTPWCPPPGKEYLGYKEHESQTKKDEDETNA